MEKCGDFQRRINVEAKTLVAIGEALIDFIPGQTGCDFNKVESFSPKCGGAPANVCGAYAVLGGKARMITQLGNDPFGHKIEEELKSYNIDTTGVCFTEEANTALAFVSLSADGNRTFSFYRKPSADMLLRKEQIKKEWFDDAYAFHFCSVSLGDFPMKEAHEEAILHAKEQGAIISFDPNLRFMLWEDKKDLHKVVWEFLPKADILKISDEELEFISGENDIQKALPILMKGNVKLVLFTCGKNGASAYTRKENCEVDGLSVEAVDTTGAGDGFIGAFLYALCKKGIGREDLESLKIDFVKEALSFANRFSAESVKHQGAIASYRKL